MHGPSTVHALWKNIPKKKRNFGESNVSVCSECAEHESNKHGLVLPVFTVWNPQTAWDICESRRLSQFFITVFNDLKDLGSQLWTKWAATKKKMNPIGLVNRTMTFCPVGEGVLQGQHAILVTINQPTVEAIVVRVTEGQARWAGRIANWWLVVHSRCHGRSGFIHSLFLRKA